MIHNLINLNINYYHQLNFIYLTNHQFYMILLNYQIINMITDIIK